jgi:UDP-2-acetamido-3-amino-2,3-dideoxy-glucuronate N-acetyltransferase
LDESVFLSYNPGKMSPKHPYKTRIALIGAGRWGKNLLREFDKLSVVASVCHLKNPKTTQWLKNSFPHIRHTNSYKDILRDPTVEAVVIATPVKTHYRIAREALLAGKHVFVEKPLAQTAAEAKELSDLAFIC